MERGFTIIEVIGAIFILVVGVVGVYSAVNFALSTARTFSSRLVAAYLAQEGIEVVRNIRDTNWLNGSAWDSNLPAADCGVEYNGNSCLTTRANAFLRVDANGFYNYQNGTTTPFQRRLRINKPNANAMQVTVTVTWSESGRQNTFVAREDFTNWNR
jgi:Tfp pilus assembly protein PilV